MTPTHIEEALVVVIPRRHLEAALASPKIVLPAGGPGDLEEARPGWPVLFIATDPDEERVPAVTWRASFIERIGFEPGGPVPEGVPSTWVEDHPEVGGGTSPSTLASDVVEEDEEDDDIGPQSFFAVTDLIQLPRSEWIFANELVPKQERHGRTFAPRTPKKVNLLD